MKTTKKMKSFVKGFVAMVTGDDATAQGERTLRQADAALNTHIHVLKSELLDLEQKLEAAKENAKKAVVNFGKPIDNRDSYVKMIVQCENELTQAEEAMADKQAVLELLQDKLEEINAEETEV